MGLGTVALDEQNAMIRARYRGLPIPVVLAAWRQAFDLLAAGVAVLPEEDLTAAGRFEWADRRPLYEALAVPTYRHEQAHARDVTAWLDRLGTEEPRAQAT
jgi:hypothetical protein